MKSLLLINASGRVTRSITRQLTARFAEGWKSRHPRAEIVIRDVGIHPPPAINETWIAAAFAEPGNHTPAMRKAILLSDTMVDELHRADVIVLGVPMYNYGMPGQLKAYFDQIVRIGRTFAFDPTAENPYLPLIKTKPVVAVLSAGNGAIHPGGELAHLNFLEPHLLTLLGFIGLSDPTVVRVGYDEYQDDRFHQSLAAAETALDQILDKLALNAAPAGFFHHSNPPSHFTPLSL
ncbi:MAG TPA: NAD(P)H-dependent oxidoreductase [Chthoniobacterales bacterium]